MIFRKTKKIKKIFLTACIFGSVFLFAQDAKAATITWDNSSADGLWLTAANWSTNTVPTATDDVVFDGTSNTAATLELGVSGITVNSLSLNAGYTNSLTMKRTDTGAAGQFTATGDITVNSGNIIAQGNLAAINAAAGGTASVPFGEGIILNAVNITVASGASINANDKGFGFAAGPGKGLPNYNAYPASGGGYGGEGGMIPSFIGGVSYGSSVSPTALGSGGGRNTGAANGNGGAGGGALKLIISDTLTVSGIISANSNNSAGGGGGSGGSLWISSGTLAGAGTISANGGSGYGGGGGGRISITYSSKTYAGTITTNGGSGNSSFLGIAGSAGTIYEDNTSSNSAPVAPTLSFPANSATLNSINPALAFSTTDTDYDYLKYKIEIATDSEFNNIVQTVDQTSSQTGWYNQTEQGRMAYAPSNAAAYIVQTALSSNTQYYWRTYAIDPSGANAWSTVSSARSFTTGTGTHNYWVNVVAVGTGLWATDVNWSLGHKPAAGEAVIFNGNISNTDSLVDVYVSLNSISLASLTLESNYSKTLTVKRVDTGGPGQFTTTGDIIVNGGNIIAQGNLSAINAAAGGTAAVPYGEGIVFNAANIIVASGASINADSNGFLLHNLGSVDKKPFGPGRGGQYGGGGYGGAGGGSYNGTFTGGSAYGSAIEPSALGSGGYRDEGLGGSGGGAIRLVIAGTLTVNGRLSTNGGNAYGRQNAGSAGGSLWVEAGNELAGSGNITANGGLGSGNSGGGGGGGGRISIAYGNKTYAGTITVNGGTSSVSGSAGSAGTIYEDNTSSNSAPAAPTISFPADSATLNSINPALSFSTTDTDYDYLKYKIEIATDAGFNNIVQTVDQTSAQTGWYNQTEQARTAYAPSNGAIYFVQTALSSNTQYYWRTYVIDPSGTNAWSTASSARSFTTGTSTANYWSDDFIFSDELWATDVNWSLGHKPAAGEAVIFNGDISNTDSLVDVYVSLNSISLASLTLESNYSRNLTMKRVDTGGPGQFTTTGDIIVNSGNIIAQGNLSAINAAAGGTASVPYGEGIVFNAANIIVASGASISADGKGFTSQLGPGKGIGNAAGGSGAGYGGAGGNSSSGDIGGAAYGNSPYNPIALGSGGGSGWGGQPNGPGGTGGGAIKIIASSSVNVNGTISANGGHGVSNNGAAGGSGGSINIISESLIGSGNIFANGGSGLNRNGAGGGGGRVVISYATRTFDGAIAVSGGTGNQAGSAGSIRTGSLSGQLVSSIYDSSANENLLSGFQWSETLPAVTSATFYLRSGATSEAVSASEWLEIASSSYNGSLTTGCVRDGSVVTCDNTVIPASLKDMSNDRFFQYKIILTSQDLSATPVIDDIRTFYVVNSAPNFNAAYGTNGVTVSQVSSSADNNWGKVKIDYAIRDIDTESGSYTANYVTPTFEYTTDGINYANVNLANVIFAAAPQNGNYGTYDGKITNKVFQPTLDGGGNETAANYLTYTAYWDAKTQIGGTYTTALKIRVKINDNEGANNIALAESGQIVLDVKNPTGLALTINGSNQAITMATPTDNSAYEMSLSNTSGVFENFVAFASPFTYAGLTSDPATVYLRIRDALGNYTDISAQTPAKPETISFFDTSDQDLNVWREFITWNTISELEVGAGFDHYNIWRKVDNGSYTIINEESDRQRNYYVDNDLDSSKVYSYKITAEDTSGSTSNFTTVVLDQPDGQGSSDRTPPSIYDVTVSDINTTSAKVTWTTDELSDSHVGFSPDPETTYLPEYGNVSILAAHQVVLTGLIPGTTYNIKVKSRDVIGNLKEVDKLSPGNNSVSDFTFTTQPGPIISSVAVPSVSNNQANVTWRTNIDSNTYIAYSDDIENGTLKEPAIEIGTPDMVGGSAPFIHEQVLENLVENKKYYFYVKSQDTSNPANTAIDNNGGNFYEFTTTLDEKSPEISDVEAAITSTNQVAIHWLTDEPSTSQVLYATSLNGEYTATAEIPLMDESHYVIISGLSADTKYYYKVISHDINENEAKNESANNYFQTLVNQEFNHGPITKIENIEIPEKNLSDKNAVVTFTTDQSALCILELTTSSGIYSNPINAFENGYQDEVNYNKSHAIRLIDLIAQTPYYFKISCHDNIIADAGAEGADKFDNWIFSEEETFTTLEKQIFENSLDVSAPEISGITASEERGESVKITWNTNEEANSLVRYGIDSNYGNMAGDDLVNLDSEKYTKEHTVTINGLVPDTEYLFTVSSIDVAGNIAESSQNTFTTAAPSSLSSIKVESPNIGEAVISWSTDQALTSIVEYGTTTSYGDKKESTSLTKEHSIALAKLNQETVYHYRVKGEDEDGNLYASADNTFEPKSPPKITNIKIDDVAEHGASVSFSTNVPTDANVTYTDTENSKETGSQGLRELMTKHEIKLNNLKQGTTFSTLISVRDEQGILAEIEGPEFTTGKDENAPKFSQIKTDGAIAQNDKVQMIISWTTDEPATTAFIYQEGSGGEKKEIVVNDAYAQNHIVVSTVFKPGTVYHFKVKSIDQAGNEAISQDYALLTPRKKENVVQIIVNNFQDIFGWAKVFQK